MQKAPAIRFTAQHFDFAAQALFFLSLVGLAVLAYGLGGVDFRGYYTPALLVTRGGNPYDYTQLAPVLVEVTGFAGNNPFFYPPYFVLFFFPFLLLPFDLARLAWLLGSAGLFYTSLELVRGALGWQVAGWRKWGAYLLALLLLGLVSLRSEQATVLALFGLALFLHALGRRQAALAGLGAVLMTIKPQVSLLVCLFAAAWMFRSYRAAFWMGVAWLIGLTGLATLIMPYWWRFDRTNFGSGLFYTWDGAEVMTGTRVNATLYDFLHYAVQVPPPWIYVLAGLVILTGAAVAWSALRAGGTPPLVPASGIVMLNLLATPYALQYDYVLLVPGLLWTLRGLPALPPTGRWITVLLIGASFATLLLQSWSYQGYWQLLFLFAAFTLVLYCTAAPFRPMSASHQAGGLKPAV